MCKCHLSVWSRYDGCLWSGPSCLGTLWKLTEVNNVSFMKWVSISEQPEGIIRPLRRCECDALVCTSVIIIDQQDACSFWCYLTVDIMTSNATMTSTLPFLVCQSDHQLLVNYDGQLTPNNIQHFTLLEIIPFTLVFPFLYIFLDHMVAPFEYMFGRLALNTSFFVFIFFSL